jgi:hypothetical protein
MSKSKAKVYSDEFIIAELPKLRKIRSKIYKERKNEQLMSGCTIKPSEEEQALVRKINSLNNLYYRRKLNIMKTKPEIAKTVSQDIKRDYYKCQNKTRYVAFTYNGLNIIKPTLESLHRLLRAYLPNINIAFYTRDNSPRYTDDTYEDIMNLYIKANDEDAKISKELADPIDGMVIAFDVRNQNALTVGAKLFGIIQSALIIDDLTNISAISSISDGKTTIQCYILS